MSISIFTLDQAEQWDNIVRSFNEYDVYWLSGYVKAFHIHGDGEPLLFYYDDGFTRGINVTMKRDVSKDEGFRGKIEEGQYYDFATPYGYGGWIIEGDEMGELVIAYEEWIKKNKIISEFVRFHPMIKNHENCGDFYEIIRLGEVVYMDLSSPELIWNNIMRQNRNKIRKAIKSNIKIFNDRFPEIYEKFRVIYNGTMDKNNAEDYYYFKPEFYSSVLEDLPQNAQVFWAEKDGQMIAASIMLSTNGKMNYHLSCSLREFSSFAPTNLLLYEAALWGYANGCKTLYMGGGVGSGEDSLFKFKKSFYKGNLNRFYIGKKIYDQERYQELIKMRNEIKSNYFPAYRTKVRGV